MNYAKLSNEYVCCNQIIAKRIQTSRGCRFKLLHTSKELIHA